MNTSRSHTTKYWKFYQTVAVLMVFVFSFGSLGPISLQIATAEVTAAQPSHNVAYIDSLTVVNGGTFPTTTTGPTGSFLDYHFYRLPYASVSLANLLPGGICGAEGCDTVFLNVASSGLYCNLGRLTAQQKTDLVSFVDMGRKLIIYDSECVSQDYSWLPAPFTTQNPGALGATGTLNIVEENTLSSTDPTSPYYINAPLLASGTDAVGDMNVMITYDSHWYLDMSGTNVLGYTGPVHTYNFRPQDSDIGLIIYNGLDVDYLTSTTIPESTSARGNLAKIWLQELQQLFNPSDLPGTTTVIGITLSPDTAILEVGENHTVTATLKNLKGELQPGLTVTFSIESGPNVGVTGTCNPTDCISDINGEVSFSYTGTGGEGTDTIKGCFYNDAGEQICDYATVEWTTPTCQVTSVQVDDSLSNDVVTGSAVGLDPCEVIIEIHNPKFYWVNYKITTSPSVSYTPSGGADNFYDFNKVLAPQESVYYLVKFTEPGQVFTAFLDVTTVTGEGGKFMNLTQAMIDLGSIFLPGFGTGFKLSIEMYQDIVNTYGSLTHLNAAGDALFTTSPNATEFLKELKAAYSAGEFIVLYDTLDELGLEGAIEVAKLILQPVKLLTIIYRSFGNVWQRLFDYPAGSINFITQ